MQNEFTNTQEKKITVEPIAIVGLSCRFPFAETLEAFWKLLSEGKETITEIPAERWDITKYFDPDPEADRKTNQRHSSLLQRIHDFDPLFFNISPAEAVEMSPSQKLMLELVWEAIENSSMPYQEVQGKKIGVYIGNIWNDFEHLRKHKNAAVTSHSAVGQSSNIIANRVSFSFGFTGPSLVVDTGCSSSLVALHIACQSLWDGSTEMALAGGINHMLDPDQNVLLSKFGGLSSKGRCSTFDSEGDGFVRGEGAGVLLLKTLSEAERHGDKIYAVIRGTAMNNNGYNVNLPATSVEGQKQVLQDAYMRSGILPSEVHYVEAHGTGTKLGDPTETKALGEFFRENREGKLHIGSVKTNIGHLEAAAGIAGLIKVVLAMQHKQLPPSLHFKNPNPNIAFDDLKLQVQAQLGAWPVKDKETLKAGINSFGWGGTNAHTIIEEYRPSKPTVQTDPQAQVFCLPITARSTGAIKDYAKAYIELFNNCSEDTFRKICASAAILKPELDHRILFTSKDKEGMLSALQNFLNEAEEITPRKPLSQHDKIVMIFPGQGSQWLGMGRELFYTEPVFRQVIEACEVAFSPYTNWSLKQQLFADQKDSRLDEIDVIQPALVAVQIALARLWMSWGVTPHVVVGHSMGEVSAAYISGALSLEDAARIICTRSRLMKTVSGTGGGMAVTELSMNDAEELVQQYPQLSIAVSNSPKSTVLAGDQQAINNVLQALEHKGLFARQVKVDVASHSKQMDPLKNELFNALQSLQPQQSIIPMYSTVRSKEMEGVQLDASYWVDNLRQTVQFSEVMQKLMKEGHVVFIEASPHPVLLNAINECADHLRKTIISTASVLREKPEQETLYKNLADIFSKGLTMNWRAYYHVHAAPDIQLPHYPFQRERYEIEDHSAALHTHNTDATFPLLGKAIALAGDDDTHYWQTHINLGSFPYLVDHQVNDMPVLPGAAYVEMILEATQELYGRCAVIISRLRFIKSITLSKEETSVVQLRIFKTGKSQTFRFYTKVSLPTGKSGWEVLAEGELRITSRRSSSIESFNSEGTVATSGTAYYEALKNLGLQYGPYFQGLKEFRKVQSPFSNEVTFTLQPEARVHSLATKYKIHPALLDACFQPLFYSVLENIDHQNKRTTFLTEVEEVEYVGETHAGEALSGIATLHPLKRDEQRGYINVEADIIISRTDGTPVLKVKGLKGKVIDSSLIEQRREKLKNWLYKINWVKTEKNETNVVPTPSGTWVVFGDPYGVSDILTDKMQALGFDVAHVIPGNQFGEISPTKYTIHYGREDDYASLLRTLFGKPKKIEGIIHIGSMSYTWQDPDLTADVVEQHQVYGSISFMYLHQQLAQLKLTQVPRLVIVTNGIQNTHHEMDVVQPVHSPLWGIAKVMFNELTHYHCRYYDLSANPSIEELEQVVQSLKNPHALEHEVAVRGNDLYVPRLGIYTEEEQHHQEAREFSATGTYLVTGFRGLGFVFIEWMIRQGARHFALVSRSGDVSQELGERMKMLEAQGCSFRIFRADAGVYQEIKTVMNIIEETMPALKGVIHAAGVIEARTLTELNQDEFLRILNPKVKGAWNLHLLTQHKNLDCFIMFSSASTLIGLSGQGSYVAANAFLDTLAYSRKRMGLPGMSINWGVMKDVGMVANKSELEKYARAEGFEPVSMNDAMEVFHSIYNHEHTQIGIVKLHAETMASYYSTLSQTPYFKGLLASENKSTTKEISYLDRLAELTSPENRVAMLEELVSQLVAKTIKTSVSRIKPSMTFKGMGIDSLMAIQLRNQIEKSINLKLSVSLFWTHPSIHEYALYLRHALAEQLLIQNLNEETHQIKEAHPAHWFVIPKPNPAAKVRLFCFHDAGGNASLYHNWSEKFDEHVEMISVELPGRGRRMNEKPYDDLKILIRDLAEAIVPYMDVPSVFFGHSMGGLIAFELTRALRKRHHKLPFKLFVSSTPGLTTYTKGEIDPSLTDDELIQRFPYLNKTTIKDDELHQLLLSLLRTDLKLINSYEYLKEEVLDIPLVVVHGRDDERVRTDQAERWCDETWNSCMVICRPGGHRYIEQDGEFLTALIQKEIAINNTETKIQKQDK
jgi:acyl transferase domain-containing protein/surfactin synthase thioesterase subunit/acyl carrier protein/NADP-dependent 3-hydroxy acid dehydrogenase YdfG